MTSKVAIITGGTRGIGLGIAEQLAATGYNLILGFNSNETAANETKKNLEAEYDIQVSTVKGDVAEAETVEKFFVCLENNFDGKLTALIHNAGLRLGLTTPPTSEQAKLAVDAQSKFLEENELINLARYDYYQNVYPNASFVV